MKDGKQTIWDAAVMAAVAAFVVALVSPVVGAARLTGAAAACLDNEQRIGRAMLRYVDDYEGSFPPNRYGTGMVWKDALVPYLQAGGSVDGLQKTFACPSNPALSRIDETGRWPRSYAYNGALSYGKYVSTGTRTDKFTIRDFADPAAFMVIMETRNEQPDLGPWMIDGNASPDGLWSNTIVIWQDEKRFSRGVFHHHDKRMNVIMLDGHTKSITLPQTIAVPQIWNPWRAPDAYQGKITGMLPEYK